MFERDQRNIIVEGKRRRKTILPHEKRNRFENNKSSLQQLSLSLSLSLAHSRNFTRARERLCTRVCMCTLCASKHNDTTRSTSNEICWQDWKSTTTTFSPANNGINAEWWCDTLATRLCRAESLLYPCLCAQCFKRMFWVTVTRITPIQRTDKIRSFFFLRSHQRPLDACATNTSRQQRTRPEFRWIADRFAILFCTIFFCAPFSWC